MMLCWKSPSCRFYYIDWKCVDSDD